MKSRSLTTLALSFIFGGAIYVSSHLATGQRVSAAPRAEGADQFPRVTTPAPVQQLPATSVQQLPAVRGRRSTVPSIRPVAPVAAPLSAASPSNSASAISAADPARTPPRLDTGERNQIIERHSDQIHRQGFCRKLEKRREALRQKHTQEASK